MKWWVVNAADTTPCTNSTLTQGCQVWLQSGSNWLEMWQIRDFFTAPKFTEVWSEKVADLSHLRPICRTLESNLTSMIWSRTQRRDLHVMTKRVHSACCYCVYSVGRYGVQPRLAIVQCTLGFKDEVEHWGQGLSVLLTIIRLLIYLFSYTGLQNR